MSKRKTLPVIFRAERSGEFKGEVTAVFPTILGASDWRSFTVYAHCGQHSVGWPGWYAKTRSAKPEEYAPLLRELRGIYESPPYYLCPLRVVSRMTAAHEKARREALS